jgi:acyl-coenzyme A thioesterase PaaI-like protein
MFALADVAACLAILARIGPVALAVTTGATIDFLRKPAPHSDLRAEKRVLKLGRVLALADALICSAGMAGQVAQASLTCSVPPPR